MLAGAIGAGCRLFQASVFRNYAAFSLKALEAANQTEQDLLDIKA